MRKKSQSNQTLPEETVQLLLRRVVELYEKNLTESESARALLDRFGIQNQTFLGLEHVGYSDGRLSRILNDEEVRAQLVELGLLTPKGAERFTGCLVFPMYDATGAILDLWAIPPTGEAVARFLHDRPNGFWRIGAAKRTSLVYVVSSPIDGFGLLEAGIGNVVGLHPERGQPNAATLSSFGVQKLAVVVGDDANSVIAISRMQERLQPFSPEVVTLPGCTGAGDYVRQHGPKKLAEVIVAATHHVPAVSIAGMRPLPDGFILTIENLRYTVTGLEKRRRQVQACVRVERGDKVWADVFNLLEGSARTDFVKTVARLMDESGERLALDMVKLIDAAEVRLAQPDLALPGSPVDPLPEGDRKEAEIFGRDPKLVSRILEDFRDLGIVGEEINCFFSYVVMTSRKMREPLAGVFQSSIGAGKNAVADKARDLCPPEDRFYASFLSGKALYYVAADALRHKLLMFEEEHGARQANYSIRILLSSGQLTVKTATRDPASGRLQTESRQIQGPVAMLMTGSDPNSDRETRSRFIVTSIDESREQTLKIHEAQLRQQSADALGLDQTRKTIERRHHGFQRLLQTVNVVIPKTKVVRCTDSRLTSRRDLPKILRLVKGIAFLRQMQKEMKQGESGNYIEVDDQDLALAQPIIRRLFSTQELREVSNPSRDLLRVLWRMQSKLPAGAEEPFEFTRRELRDESGMANTSLYRCVRELEAFELIVRDTSSRRQPVRYRLEWSPETDRAEPVVVFEGLQANTKEIPVVFQNHETRKAARA